ncbi:MAG TPA: hypothetical protein VKE92_03440, partial [Anaerolineales bacterium]|nr:hypothetical protein [Anaerolineales bacterium]
MHTVAHNRRPLTILFLFALLLFALSYWVQSTEHERLNAAKIAQLLRLFSTILLLTAGFLHLTSNSSVAWIRRNSFGATIAIASSLLLIGYRFLIGAGIGLRPASGNNLLSSGFLYYPEDNFSYAAWAAQAANGAILFHDPYTLLEHPGVYFNPFFFVIGFIARVLDVSVLPLMILTGIFSSAFVIGCIYTLCKRIHFPEGAARWATILAAFSSGISVPAYYFGRWLGISIPVGADLRYMDSVLFSTFYTLPYQSFAYALQACLVLILLRCERENSKSLEFVLLGLVQVFSVFTRPYEWLLLIGGYAIYVAFSHTRSRKQFLILSVLLITAAPGLLYNWWISRQEVWQSFAEITMAQEKFRLYWVTGYGLMIPLAVTGAIVIWRSRNLILGRW